MTKAASLRLLRASEASGDLGDRELGLDLGLRSLQENGLDQELALHVGRALRAQYRTTYDLSALELAETVLRTALEATPGRAGAALGAEYARLLIATSYQIEVRARPGTEETASQMIADLLARAGAAAAAALEAAGPGSPEQGAASAALGSLRLRAQDYAEARALLIEAVRLTPDDGQTWLDLAEAYASDSTQDPAEATALLTDTADRFLRTHPRTAFEAARFHGFWAAERAEWSEAGDAYRRTLDARLLLRREQGDHVRSRLWMQEAGAVPSAGACAYVRAGRLAEAAEVLDSGLALNLSDRLGRPVRSRAEHAPARAPRPEAVVHLAFDAHGGAAIVRRPDGQRVGTLLPEASRGHLVDRLAPLLGAYSRWRSAPSPGSRRTWVRALDDVLAWVGDTVLGPALRALADDPCDLLLVTDGLLGVLPLFAVPVDGSPLVDTRRVRSAPTLRILNARHADPVGPGGATLVASVPGWTGPRPLRFAAVEGRAVAALRPRAQLLADDAATTREVEAHLPRSAFVHMACHAMSDPFDPMRSRFELADGPLSLERLLTLRMDAARLVVASACETALADVGNPEEFHSLAGGLLHAGVAGVIASLWATGDRAALILSLRLHTALVRAPDLDPCAELRAAQRWLRESTAGEIRRWLDSLADDADDATWEALTAVMAHDREAARPFQQTIDWACFDYFGS